MRHKNTHSVLIEMVKVSEKKSPPSVLKEGVILLNEKF